MTAYAVAMIRVTDTESLGAYRAQAAEALARHGGEVVHASPEPKAIEGTPVLPDIMALIRFPDRDAADAWIADPALSEVHALRQSSGSSDILLF